MESINERYLISGSHDGSVRIFNIQKIECNTTCEAEGVYEINSEHPEDRIRINSVAVFENTFAVAVASNKGNIRVFQIERMKSGSRSMENHRKNRSEGTSYK